MCHCNILSFITDICTLTISRQLTPTTYNTFSYNTITATVEFSKWKTAVFTKSWHQKKNWQNDQLVTPVYCNLVALRMWSSIVIISETVNLELTQISISCKLFCEAFVTQLHHTYIWSQQSSRLCLSIERLKFKAPNAKWQLFVSNH